MQARFKSVDRALAIDVYSFGIVLWEMVGGDLALILDVSRSHLAVCNVDHFSHSFQRGDQEKPLCSV